jgi:anti-sigma regulatory factor (Ser/Thr protein kinase)
VRSAVAADPTAASFDPMKQADAELVVSELVTNAVLHAHGPIACAVDLDDGVLRIEVSDADPSLTDFEPHTVQLGDPTGRGLTIIAAVALAWSVRTGAEHKTVWARVPLR